MHEFGPDDDASICRQTLLARIEELENELQTLRKVAAERDQLLRMKTLVLSRMHEAAYLVDENGRFVYANDEASRKLGYSADELTQMSVMDIDPDWIGAKWSEGWIALREQGSLHINTTHRRKDGGAIPVEVDCQYFEYGGRQYNLSLVQDMSERQRAQRELSESDARYRQIFDNVSDALYLVDVTSANRFRLIEVNPACELLFGRTRAELVQRFLDDILPAGAAVALCAAYQRCVAAPAHYEEELTIELPRGPIHCRSTLMPVRDAAGHVYRIVGIIHDLTLQREAQSLLTSQRELDARFNRLAESSPEVICRHDRECRLVFANVAFDEVVSTNRAAALGKLPLEIVDNGNMRRYQAALQVAMETASAQDLELVHYFPSGTRYDQVRIFPEFGLNGEVTGALALGLDVTAHREAEERLYASEEAFRAVVEHSPDYIARYDLQYRRIYANPVLASVSGPVSDCLTEGTSAELSVFADAPRYMDLLRQVVETGIHATAEMVIVDASGSTRWGHLRIVPEMEPDGKVASVLSILRDIDELKRSEQLFRALAENFPDAICRFDSECRLIYVNAALVQNFRVTPEQFYGRRPTELVPGSDTEKVRYLERQVRRTFEEGESNELELPWEMGGGKFVLEIRYIPEKQDDGQVRSVLAIVRDITKLRETEQALRDSERAFRALAENAPDPIIRYDLDCRRTYVNPEFERVARMNAAEMLGKPAGDRRGAPEIAERLRVLLCEVMKSGMAAKFELNWHDGYKDQSWYVHAVPEFNAGGAVQSALTVWRDISERKEAEHRLRESYEMLRELTSRRETAREEERKRIAREMHDELGQQLTALRMGISTLRIVFARNNPELADHIKKLLMITDRTMQVVRNVVTSLRPSAIDAGIVPALEWLADEFSRDTGTVCRLAVPRNDIELDEERAVALFRIVQEALTNVARHAGAHEVTVELQQVDDECLLEVRDDGQGFDPDAIRRNSFGLAGMNERMVMLRGEIIVDSTPGCGTSIKVRVPIECKR